MAALTAFALGLILTTPAFADQFLITGPTDTNLVLSGNFVLAEYYGTDQGPLPIGGVVFRQNNARFGAPVNTTFADRGLNFGTTPDATNFNLISSDNAWSASGFSFTVPTVAGRNYALQLIFHDNFFPSAGTGPRQFDVSAGGVTLASSLDLVAQGAGSTNAADILLTYNITNADGNPLSIVITPVVQNPVINALTLQDLSPPPVPPLVTTPPAPTALFAGRSLALSAVVAGTSLTYQWQAGATGSGLFTNLTDGGNVSGSATTALTITNITLGQAADYQLVATNTAGAATSAPPATVTVLSGTVITPGSNYAYAIITNNPADYWRLNESAGSPLVYDNGPGAKDATPGASLSLGVPGPQPTDFPGFESTNTAMQSANGTLNDYVTAPPLNLNTNAVTMLAWLNPSGNQLQGTGIMISRNGNISNLCSGLSYDTQLYPNGDYTLNYIWNGDLWQLPASDSGLQVPQNVWSLVGLVVTPTNATIYVVNTNGLASFTRVANHAICPFTNPFLIGNDTFDNAGHRTFNGSIDEVAIFSHALTANQILRLFSIASGVTVLPPTVSAPPAVTVVKAGANVSLTASGSGTPAPTYQWKAKPLGLNGVYTNLVDGGSITGSHTNSLVISNVSIANAGDYVLFVSNSVGTATSSKARVLVLQPLAPALIGQWLSGVQDYTDKSGFNPAGQHDAVAVGGGVPSFVADVPAGYSGYSLQFGGASALAVTNTAQSDSDYRITFDHDITNRFTIAFWAKGFPTSGWSPWVTKNGESVGWQLRRIGTRTPTPYAPTFSVRGTTGNADAGDGASLNIVDGLWHHYAGTYDSLSGVRHLYVDGAQVINVYGDWNGSSPASAYHLVMGARENPGLQNYFPGQLFDVRMYSYPLSEGEVQGLVTPPPPNAVSLFLSATNVIPQGQSEAFTLCIPPGANQSSAVTVLVTNLAPAVAAIEGATNNVFAVTFAAGAPSCQYFTLDTIGVGQIQLAAGDAAGVLGADTSVPVAAVVAPQLIGQWLAGTNSLADTSGFSPPGTHDGLATHTSVGDSIAIFTSDVPAGFSGQSLLMTNYLVSIMNSSTLDGGYTTTYDNDIAEAFSVSFWAKIPSTPTLQAWQPFVAKRGERSSGWKVRAHGTDGIPDFTIRMTGDFNNDDPFNSPTLLSPLANAWHHFAATWDGVAGVRKLYVDGALSLTEVNDNGPIGLANVNYLTIGGWDQDDDGMSAASFTTFLTGQMFDVRIYNYALNASELSNIINSNTTALVAASDSATIDQGHTGTVSFSLPTGANASSPVTVWVTNLNPSVVSIAGAAANVFTVTFPAGAYASKKLTLTGLSQGQAQIALGASGFTSAATTVEVYGNQLIGRWLAGSQNLRELSGFMPAGTHDGVLVGSNHLVYSTDVPAGFPGRSLLLDGTFAVRITNSCADDPGYAPTFDDIMANNFTIAFWTKALNSAQPNQWVAFVSKRGDDAMGYQVRRNAGNNYESFTLRQTALHAFEDNGGTTGLLYNGAWHHVAAVWDGYGGTRKLYVDGVLEPAINLTGDFGPFDLAKNHHLILGSEDNNSVVNPAVGQNGYLHGQLYEVRIFNYPLSVPQVQGLMAPEVPALTVVRTGPGTITVSWPSAALGYVLQTSSGVAGGWANSGLAVTSAGGTNMVMDTVGASATFYRLILP